MKWINHDENEKSIEAILRALIRHEHNAEIEPIDPNSQFIIKSFVDYVATEFSEYNGFNVVGEASVSIENEKYIIKRFSNNMIRLFDESGEPLNVEVLPILRKINNEKHLGIDIDHSPGKAKNTQILGREIINELNKRKL